MIPFSTCLVGNAPVTENHGALIDQSDLVIRLNKAFGLAGVNGMRTTHLFLINCGGQMGEWLESDAFSQMPALASRPRILLPIHPAKDDWIQPPLSAAERADPAGANHAPAALARLAALGFSAELIAPDLFARALEVIGQPFDRRTTNAPSTGLIALLWALATDPCPIGVFGFGFEGWAGHRWDREADFFQSHADTGRIILHPAR